MALGVQVDGLDDMSRTLSDLTGAIRRSLAATAEQYRDELQQAAVALAPLDQGVLESNIQGAVVDGDQRVEILVGASRPVESGADIALWLHERTEAPLGHQSPPAPGWGPGTVSKPGWGGRPAGYKYLEYPLLQLAPRFRDAVWRALLSVIMQAAGRETRDPNIWGD